MKKTKIIVVIVAIVILVLMAGCSNTSPSTEAISTEVTSTEATSTEATSTEATSAEPADPYEGLKQSLPVFDFSDKSGAMLQYRHEVEKRTALLDSDEDATFLSIDENLFLKTFGYDIPGNGTKVVKYSSPYYDVSKSYYPIIAKAQNGAIVLVYTTEYGTIHSNDLEGYSRASLWEYVHIPEANDQQIVWSSITSSGTFDGKAVNWWRFGNLVESFDLPEDSVYCGESFWEGYLFRSGNDLYGLGFKQVDEDTRTILDLTHLATGVAMVLDPDYQLNSDAWSQPLLLMESGEVLAYCGWPNLGEEPDDPAHLVSPQYEGSFKAIH